MEQAQNLVDRYFESTARYWNEVYCERDLAGTIYQRRKEETLKWVSDLCLSPNSRVIDVGCGSGTTSVAIAGMGHSVWALDRVPAMLEQTRRHAEQGGVAEQVSPILGDVSALQFDDGSFDLTIALGLLPWVGDPVQALGEMLRVTKPNGHLILSSDNSRRLNYLLDPIENPLFAPLRRQVADWLRRAGLMRADGIIAVRMQSVGQFQTFLHAQNLQIVREATIGFGPFTFLRRSVIPARLGIRLHDKLQSLADSKFPLLSATGAHHLVLVKRRFAS
jgi:ubiquinone/menaquinone biosynthesis C-methylase UbiE